MTTTRTPTDAVLTASLLLAPLLSLAADSTYAARGWDDATGGVLHVIGAIAYGFVVLKMAGWASSTPKLAVAILAVGLIGLAGNVAYGFEAIHRSFGDVELVDRSGAANLIKPLGLMFPVSLGLMAAALAGRTHRWQAGVVLIGAIAWPIGHIGNIAAVAVPTNVLLVVAFGSLVWPTPSTARAVA